MLTHPHRNEAWQFDLLDLENNLVGEVEGVEGGTLDFSIHNTIRSGGSLEYTGEPVDWDRHRVRVWYILKHDGEEYGWPLGTFNVATGSYSHADTSVATTLTLYDNLLLLDQDGLDTFYTVTKGTPVMEALEQVVTSGLVYSPGFTMDETTEVVRSDRVWEPTDENTRLRIANDLAESINYGALDTNGYGGFESRHLGSAGSRGISWVFDYGQASIYNADFLHERDTANVYNKVVGFVEGDDESAGFTAVATDENPDSPWSFPARGRWVTGRVDPGEAVTQTVLQERVERALRDSQQVASGFDIVHDVIPLKLNDAVTFQNEPGGFNLRAVVPSFTVTIDFEGGSEMQTRLREVLS